ncbi:MAG: AAA family ATPase [Lachnospiraceae bacterium]|nr:AAA family ATPase [Lachnospiraceae bacterium]
MEAPTGKVKKRFPNNFIESKNGYDVLKTAVIVGENAGGKSNFINGIKFLKSFFTSNAPVKTVHSYINTNSLIGNLDPVQSFAMMLLHDSNVIYSYSLSIDKTGIVSEKLEKGFKRKGSVTEVFHITRDENGKYSANKENSEKQLKTVLINANNSYGLFITKLALLGDEDAQNVTDWFLNKLFPGAIQKDQESEIKKQEADIEILKDSRYLEIFQMVDYSICGIEVDMDKPYSKSIIIRKDADGREFRRELQEDSTGVREFFSWAVQIYRVVVEDKIVLADEMDRVLNPVLSDRVIAYINGMDHYGQFIFSTHNVLHLDLVRYMKEQIYFITKDIDNLISELYSLADFPEIRYNVSKVYEFYMKGILGGTANE